MFYHVVYIEPKGFVFQRMLLCEEQKKITCCVSLIEGVLNKASKLKKNSCLGGSRSRGGGSNEV
jgi:hypothetical protein